MNNTSPLLPQGSLLEQKSKNRARVKIAVFVVLAIHGIGLLALLMQGCKKEAEPNTLAEQNTNPPPEQVTPPAPPPPDTNVVLVATNPAPAAIEQPTSAPTEYVVVQGDSFSAIAKKFHLSVNGLMAANPGIEPTKLQIGQKLHIPPPPAPSATASASSTPTAVAGLAAGDNVYTVKSGDTLTSIAGQYKVTIRALRSVNSLTTDKIKVGQKLKIPGTNATTVGSTSSPSATSGGQ